MGPSTPATFHWPSVGAGLASIVGMISSPSEGPHASGYRRLLGRFLEALDRRLDEFPAIDPKRVAQRFDERLWWLSAELIVLVYCEEVVQTPARKADPLRHRETGPPQIVELQALSPAFLHDPVAGRIRR